MTRGVTSGKVYLVGAGPGDPGLITVRGLAELRRAEVVVYDALAARELLEEAPAQAERIDAGKRGGRASARQEEIEALLVERARAGKRVVRLKGGDPFVFGRGGEEALALARAGVAFEVVPGVTAGVAAPACAGIPVTHRGLSASVAFVTAREDAAKGEAQVDWRALAGAVQTIVAFMGAGRLAEVASALREGGLPASTPAAVVRWGATPRQETATGTLGDIAERASGLGSPALLVVGRVVSLRGALQWFERRPLFGRCIVATRPREQSAELVGRLTELGAEVLTAPAIRVEPLSDFGEVDAAIERLGEFDWVVFTSVNGVRHFFERLGALGRDARALGGAKVAAIGPATAAALGERGVRADAVPVAFRSEAMVAALESAGGLGGARVLLPRSDIAPDDIVAALASRGAQCLPVTVYRTAGVGGVPEEVRERLGAGGVDVVTFTSSSTVREFARAAGVRSASDLGGARVASIGPATSRAAREAGLAVEIEAKEHTAAGLAAAIVEWALEGRDATGGPSHA